MNDETPLQPITPTQVGLAIYRMIRRKIENSNKPNGRHLRSVDQNIKRCEDELIKQGLPTTWDFPQ